MNKTDKLSFKNVISKDQVQIVGPLKLQNELMAWYLHNTTGLKCQCCKDLDLDSLPDQPQDQQTLVLLDCLSVDLSNLQGKIGIITDSGNSRYYIALINVAAGQAVGNDLVNRGVRGIFYNDHPLSNLSKGVLAILQGEFWFSREKLVECLLDTRQTRGGNKNPKISLTAREMEILFMITSGVSNSQIAEGLIISPHTVKTHIYNIYRKINVPNRLQAALWAAKNL